MLNPVRPITPANDLDPQPDIWRVGDWTFSPRSNELRQGEARRRLEDRAARTLELLCRHRGEAVTQEAIVAQVWNGRALSPNSVAVVMGDLRRALGDDARSPRYIETVAKRGYRLIAGDAPVVVAAPAPKRRAPLAIAALAVALLAAVVVLATVTRDAGGAAQAPVVLVGDVTNETGDARYDPLTRAYSELVATSMARQSEATVVRNAESARRLDRPVTVLLSGKLILWNGHPAVGLSATDPRTGAVTWSGMSSGPAEALPGRVMASVAEFSGDLKAGD